MARKIIIYIAAFASAYAELVLVETRNPGTSVLLSAFDALIFGTLANALVDMVLELLERTKLEGKKKRTLKTKSFSLFNRYVKNVKGGSSHTVVMFEDNEGNRYSFIDIGAYVVEGDYVDILIDCFKQNGNDAYDLAKMGSRH